MIVMKEAKFVGDKYVWQHFFTENHVDLKLERFRIF